MLGSAPLGGAPLGAPAPQGGGTVVVSGHRYWRVVWDNTDRGSAGCAKLEFHTSIGGADISGSGTPMCSSSYAGDQGQPAFDNDPTTNWSSDFGQTNGWLGMDFGSGRPSVVEIALLPRQDGTYANTDSPKPGGLEYSDDANTWTRLFTFTRATYVANTTYIFNVNSAGQALTDGALVTDLADASVYSLNGLLTETITTTDVPAVRWTAQIALAELLHFGDYTYQGAYQYNPVPVSIAEGVTLSSSLVTMYASLGVLAETLQVADTLSALNGVVVTEWLRLPNTLTAQATFNVFMAEAARLADQVRNGVQVTLAETLALTSLLDAKTAVLLLDGIRLNAVLGGGAQFGMQLAERMRLADSLAQFFGASITDAVGVADLLTSLRMATSTLVDGVTIGDGFEPLFLMSVTLADGIELTDAQAVQMLFDGEAVDGVEISGGYLEPNGSFTAWAMNVRTGAVTEYGNFAFNSFAAIGNRYIGASEDGLYELLGDDDAGTPIVATLAGGYMQFGGTQLSRLKEAYIAAFGEGGWVLKIMTGDGDTYVYQTNNRTGRNTKVHMGKGMRARYFAWELTSVGQDFDLDTLEFVPLVVQRRV